MAKNTSISLGPHFEKFVRREISKGRFDTASEVIRAGLRLLEEEEAKVAAIRKALEAGEASGFADDYSIDNVLRDVKRRARTRNAER